MAANGEILRLVDLSDLNVDVVFVDPLELLNDTKAYFKQLLVAGAAQQSSLRSAPSSSSTGAARRSTSPFRRRRSEEKKVKGDDKPSSATAIDPSDASAVAASNSSAGAMDDIERRLWIVVTEVTEVYAQHMQLSLRVLQLLWGCVVTGRGVLFGGVVCADDVGLSAMLSVPQVEQLPSLVEPVST
ncbi:uncharacterized protein MONOS_7674 [Monocercomonoides exilis]|uniref:uncharacterized protein n=1 Tax=Monocercomonoides exilis TaxID=2049356 RepID=UPI0035593935|nr:hypothetical protein MONOS_7674 [Monocercomonoides exilis]|eukprot:MONOS_7674.1-p1 / transcript=MONOS_7674.1 / gene=MONOS_7674 / organism=Monocercomonoides_exilis_PA203 / gene_product=unspecified product / transcript_product=unspecified product / location=Mono_scaffold00268:33940-34709(-) / protein_length=186 / sequence_SO=supercontig / SO=protein_coding / is_pseudo=false